MLTDTHFDTGYARISTTLSSGSVTHGASSTTFTNQFYSWFRSTELPLYPFDILFYLNIDNTAEGCDQSYYISDHPPVADLSALYGSPYFSWMNRFNSIVELFRGSWDFQKGACMVPHENPCLHRNIVGQTFSGQHDAIRYRSYYDSDGVPLPYTKFAHTQFGVISVGEALSVVAVSPGSYPIGIFGSWGHDLTDRNIVRISDGEFDYNQTTIKSYTYDVSFEMLDGKSELAFTWLMGKRYTAGWKMTLLRCSATLVPTYSFKTVQTGVTYNLTDIAVVTATVGKCTLYQDVTFPGTGSEVHDRESAYTRFNVAQGLGIVPALHPTWSQFTSCYARTPFFTGTPLGASRVGELIGFVEPQYIETHNKTYRAFHRRFEHDFPQFAAGCFSSTQDAINTLIKGLESNMVETASEAKQLLAPVDLAKAMEKVLIYGRGGGLMDLLRLCANVDLCVKFGILPTVRVAEDLSENLLPFINRLKSGQLYLAQTCNGKASWILPESYSQFSNTRVVCRSKVRLYPNLDGILPYILPLEGLGLLPTMSRIWNSLPWTWLIDKGFNIGSAGRLVDTQAMFLLFDVAYSVHTVVVNYDFTADDENEYGFKAADEKDSPGYQLFARYVLNKSLPVIGPTALPMFLPPELPSWDILGSVIIQKFGR